MAHYEILDQSGQVVGAAAAGEMTSVYSTDGVFGYGSLAEAMEKNPNWKFNKIEDAAYFDLKKNFEPISTSPAVPFADGAATPADAGILQHQGNVASEQCGVASSSYNDDAGVTLTTTDDTSVAA